MKKSELRELIREELLKENKPPEHLNKAYTQLESSFYKYLEAVKSVLGANDPLIKKIRDVRDKFYDVDEKIDKKIREIK